MNPTNSIWVLYKILTSRIDHSVLWVWFTKVGPVVYHGRLTELDLVDPLDPDRLILSISSVTGELFATRIKVEGPDQVKLDVARGFHPEDISADGSVLCVATNNTLVIVYPLGWKRD